MYNILVLDDQPAIVNAIRRTLARIPPDTLDSPCRVHGFDDPAMALDSLRDHPYDTIISDLRLPRMDGLAFLRRARERQPDAIRLVITGHGDLSTALTAINDLQVYRFIPKPWDDAELQRIVVSALQVHKSRCEDRHLADEVRLRRGELSAETVALRELEAECPGITQVERDATGAIILRD